MNKNILFPEVMAEIYHSKLETYEIDGKKINVWKSIASVQSFGEGVFELSSSEQLSRGKQKLSLLISGKKSTELKIKVIPAVTSTASDKKTA